MGSRLVFGLAFFALSLSSGTALSSENPDILQIIVSKDQQSLVVYDGDTVIATSNVSTGKPGHDTPTGVFSVLEKARYHTSNIYSDAPMPFMQRLTWSGIALHASGHVPRRPASHGCVRLPSAFAKSLYKMTRTGVHVLITDRQIQPAAIENATLFQPRKPAPMLLSDVQLRPSVSEDGTTPVEMAMNGPAVPKAEEIDPRPPIRILITRRSVQDKTRDAQSLLNDLGYQAGNADGHIGQQTTDAIRAFQQSESLPVTGKMDDALVAALYAKAGKGTPPDLQLFVRSTFNPVFDMPVVLKEPQRALGTHFFQFQDIDSATHRGHWFVTSMDNVLAKPMKVRLGITMDADVTAFNAAANVLSRIEIPADLRQKVEEMITNGSSLTISDVGLGPETGTGTDFVTLTRT